MKRIGKNAFIITSVVLLMLTIISYGVSDADGYSNETLNGAWLVIPNNGAIIYFIGDGSGVITELSGFGAYNPPGSYQVQPNGSLTVSFNFTDGTFNAIGTLTSSTEGTLEGTGANQGITANIYKVTDLSVCEGTWIGTLTENYVTGSNIYNITLIINSNGAVTSLSGLQPPVSGHMFYGSGHLVAFFKTGSPDSYNQVGFRGSLSGNTISGTYDIDAGEGHGGTFILTKSSGADSPIAEFTSNVTSGMAPLTVYFSDQSTGTVSSWNWNFGDGSTSNEQNPSHIYNASGIYTVILAVAGPSGSNTKTKADYIQVSNIKTMHRIGSWKFTGSLEAGRYGHTATLLPDGQVLVAGGYNDSGTPLKSAELYNPNTGAWTYTGSMTDARVYHTATLLPSGKVLVAGGRRGKDEGIVGSAELYDPKSKVWTVTGNLNYARYDHTATLLNDGRVLVAGGVGTFYLNSAEIYDPGTGSWNNTGALNVHREQHTATLLKNGQVLVAGGWTNEGGYHIIENAEIYNPNQEMENWTITGSLADARASHSATLLPNGQVLVAGGQGPSGSLNSAELYDTIDKKWHSTGSLKASYTYLTATLLRSGQVLVAGMGYNYAANSEFYTPSTKIWTPIGPPINVGRVGHTATLLKNGRVLVAGGTDVSGHILRSAELFLPSASQEGIFQLLLDNQ